MKKGRGSMTSEPNFNKAIFTRQVQETYGTFQGYSKELAETMFKFYSDLVEAGFQEGIAIMLTNSMFIGTKK